MPRSVYLTSLEGDSGKSTPALGLVDVLTRRVSRVGVFRPVTQSFDLPDRVVRLLLAHPGVQQEYEQALGVSYDDMHADPRAALETIVARYHELAPRFDALVVLGSD